MKKNEKLVLDVQDIRLSLHKEAHPEDSDLAEDIGLSSEEESNEMEEQVYIARKFVKTSPAPPPPPPQPAPPTTTVTTATTSTSTEPEMASVHVPVAALQQVHQLLGQMLGGDVPAGGAPVPPVPQPQSGDGDGAPFEIPKPKRGEKNCSICKRVFWSTTTLRQHMKTHTGEQKHTCPNTGCGRKLSSKRSLEKHLETCQKEKTFFCPREHCEKLFATKEGLAAHSKTHKSLSKKKGVCPGCGKTGFTRQKSIDDHYRYCDANPDKVGPFPCPVARCPRGPAKPFRRTRNYNAHMKDAHGFDPKHV